MPVMIEQDNYKYKQDIYQSNKWLLIDHAWIWTMSLWYWWSLNNVKIGKKHFSLEHLKDGKRMKRIRKRR